MDRYVVTQIRELIIEAPSAAVARRVAEAGFAQKLRPENIRQGMSISNVQNVKLLVEKVK